jgi:O-6-methylguanine DNA methyltransferase
MIQIFCKQIKGLWFAAALDDENAIIALNFSPEERSIALIGVLNGLPLNTKFEVGKPNRFSRNLLETLYAIYEGKEVESSFKLNMDRLTQFTQEVLLKVAKIPRGYVMSYGAIADATSHKKAARAVGNAMANNPFPPLIPCHRVILSNRRLGNYGLGFEVKKDILEREGVTIKSGLVERKCLWNFR